MLHSKPLLYLEARARMEPVSIEWRNSSFLRLRCWSVRGETPNGERRLRRETQRNRKQPRHYTHGMKKMRSRCDIGRNNVCGMLGQVGWWSSRDGS